MQDKIFEICHSSTTNTDYPRGVKYWLVLTLANFIV